MRRLTTALFTVTALSALPVAGPVSAQDAAPPAGGYTVMEGNTLWDLAEQFLGDPFEWRTIWEANRSTILNPDLIYPGQVINIPTEGGMIQVTVVPQGQRPTEMAQQQAMPAQPQARERTIFYPDTTSDAVQTRAAAEARYVAVAEQASWSAPFLLERADVEMVGRVVGWHGPESLRSGQTTAQPFDRLELETPEPLPVGSSWLTVRREFREGLGEIVIPTSMLTITQSEAGASVGLVEIAFDRTTTGNELVALPEYRAVPGARAAETMDGVRANALGYRYDATIHGPGDIVFLDVGADEGVRIGDEFTVIFAETGERTRGVAQVLRVDATGSSARITGMRNPVFTSYVELVQSRRMPPAR